VAFEEAVGLLTELIGQSDTPHRVVVILLRFLDRGGRAASDESLSAVLEQLLPVVRPHDDLLDKYIMTLWEAKGETAAPLFMAAAAEVPGLVSLRTALVVAEKFLRALPPDWVESLLTLYAERLVLALQAVSNWAEASQEAREAREALDAFFRFAGFVITKCQSTTAQRLIGIAEGLLPAFVAIVPIVRAALHFLAALPDEAAGYLSSRYAGLMIDLFRECEDARPSNGAGMALLTLVFRFHRKLYAATPDSFAQQLTARINGLPNSQELVYQYQELLRTDRVAPPEMIRRFFQVLYEAMSS
jgi:hypothetical protein